MSLNSGRAHGRTNIDLAEESAPASIPRSGPRFQWLSRPVPEEPEVEHARTIEPTEPSQPSRLNVTVANSGGTSSGGRDAVEGAVEFAEPGGDGGAEEGFCQADQRSPRSARRPRALPRSFASRPASSAVLPVLEGPETWRLSRCFDG